MKCGFFKQDITPYLGCQLSGYPRERYADKMLDPLYMRAVAFQNEGTVIFICCDLLGTPLTLAQDIRAHVADYVGCEVKDVIVSSTHIHTGPSLVSAYYREEKKYREELKHWAARAAQGALDDLKEAQLSFARSEVKGISFVRRYQMKDGSVQTNPGRHNPDIVGPVNPGDDTLQLLRVTREGAGDVLLVNFQVHPDVVSGTNISADYPGVVCDTLEGALPGVKVMYLNGTAGDLNHIDVNCPEWDRNAGKEQALHMGRKIAGEVLAIYTKARPLASGKVRTAEKENVLLRRKPDPEKLPYFQEVLAHYEAGDYREWLISQGKTHAMEKTIALMEARNMLAVGKLSPEKSVWVPAAAIGDVAFVGIPGEPFCEVGKQIRAKSPFALQFVMGTTNGFEGYYPTEEAFKVNGYESRTSMFEPGVAERLIESANSLVQELFEAGKEE